MLGENKNINMVVDNFPNIHKAKSSISRPHNTHKHKNTHRYIHEHTHTHNNDGKIKNINSN